MHKGLSGKRSAYLGAVLIAIGILFNKWFIEATLISDHRIEAGGARGTLAWAPYHTVLHLHYLDSG